MTGLEWVALVSLLVNSWQFYDRGDLQGELNQLRPIVEQCSVDKEKERKLEVNAADERERKESDLAREFVGWQFDSREILRDARGHDEAGCLATDSVFGSDLFDRGQQTVDRLNDIRVRGRGTPKN